MNHDQTIFIFTFTVWPPKVTALLYNLFKHFIKQLQNSPRVIVLERTLGSSLDFLDKYEVSFFFFFFK